MERTLNAVDAAGNSWDFSFASNSALTNEVFTSPRLCDSACQTNALARLVDTYSRPVGYNLAIDGCPRSRVRYGYDAEGRIATLVATNAANRGFQVSYLNEAGYNYGYTLTTPNGATLTRTVTRDPYRRSLTLDCTTRFNNVVVASFAHSFDAGNRPVARNSDTFTYNVRDEILSAVIGTNTISHAYDTIGNHVFCAFNSATNFYANNQLNQTTASYRCAPTSASDDATPQDDATPPLFDGYDILSTNKFTWSAQGGLQRDGRFIYAFDAEDQLVSVTSATVTNGAIRVVNAYDYRHRRIAKTVYTMRDDSPPASPLAPPLPIAHRSWHLQERHDFVYDDWNLIHETVTAVDANSTTNVTEIEYFWGPDLSNSLQGAGGVGGLLAVSQNGQFYFPVYDNLGNIVKYLDESGTVVASYIYDDFGRMLTATGTLATSLSFLFSTKYFDCQSDLYCYGYRFYSLCLRKWLCQDPIEEEGGLNLYVFCRNNCLADSDMLGMSIVEYVTAEGKEVRKSDDVRVTLEAMNHAILKNRITSWGQFFSEVQSIYKCKVYVRIGIRLHPKLANRNPPDTVYQYEPHRNDRTGGKFGTLENSKGVVLNPLRDSVFAHEKGHLKAFWENVPVLYERMIADYVLANGWDGFGYEVAKSLLSDATKHFEGEINESANKATFEWFKKNGYLKQKDRMKDVYYFLKDNR